MLSCLIQDNISLTDRNLVNLFVVYQLDTWSRDLSINYTLGDSLFGACEYNGYGIEFHVHFRVKFKDP